MVLKGQTILRRAPGTVGHSYVLALGGLGVAQSGEGGKMGGGATHANGAKVVLPEDLRQNGGDLRMAEQRRRLSQMMI